MLLEIKDLYVKYNDTETNALDGVSLRAGQGERIALIGRNGAGKSTLLLTICGALQAECGVISADGVELCKKTLAAIRKKTGMVFQNPDDQLFMPTIRDDIAFGPRNIGIAEEEAVRLTDEIMLKLGISHIADRMPHRLSGGEKRLAALAGLLVTEPELLLMDEPSSFLDPSARRRLIAVLSELSQTMIIATHDLGLAAALCTRAVALDGGKRIADGDLKNVLADRSVTEICGFEAEDIV